MRWEALFADLESQLDAQLAEDLREEIAESLRVERARQTLSDRLLAWCGRQMSVRLAGGQEAYGILGPIGEGYLCLEGESSRWLIRHSALRSLPLESERTADAASLASAKFPAVVRALSRDRHPIAAFDVSGHGLGEGTIEQAGADFLILGIHPRDEFARPRSVQARLLVPYSSLGWITLKNAG